MKTLTQIEIEYQHAIGAATRYLEFLHAHRASMVASPSFWGNHYLDFDGLTRPQILEVIKAFPGKWTKTLGYNDEIVYTLDHEVDGFRIRICGGEPPPSCKIEEIIEYKEVPARVERIVRRRIVCPEPVEAQIGPEPSA